MKRILTGFAFAAVAVSALAQNHGAGFEPAQRMIDDTISRIDAEHREAHVNFGGHVAKAAELLRQAKAELEAADQMRR
ncbi:hypothetical protein [Caballeronia insecticola]|uniref:hypothetical protein n=1 Tax=Caballeronia insecticola TaxID=758793 RepID=UPI0005C79414|nr:hypothetical protein [Caballeronia insecticola]